MTHPQLPRGITAAVAFAVPAVVAAALAVSGCSSQPSAPRPSVETCVQYGMSAVRTHVTVTALPPACRGLTPAEIDSAAGAALRSAANGVRGKAQRRQRIAAASRYLAHMFVPLPAPGGEPPRPAPATRLPSRTTLGLIALAAWLVTIALGLGVLAGRLPRGRAAARLRRLPALNLAHLGLAAVSLLAWAGYLATAAACLAWAGAGLLPLVAGLGMALLFLRLPAGGRRIPVLTIGAHVAFAIATILFAVLAAVGIA